MQQYGFRLLMALVIMLGSVCLAGAKGQKPVEQYAANLPKESVSQPERHGLVFMYEEEKLARDVYAFLYQRWRMPIFANISASEQQHMNAIESMLDKYGIPVPVVNNENGYSSDPKISNLYMQLMKKGQKSLVDALTVGATIEDLDIADLQSHLRDVDSKDIAVVYQNLMKGSRNHMRAFYGQLSGMGHTYKAQYISQDELQRIVSTGKERGVVDEQGNPI